MPKLIIANAYELYQANTLVLSQDDINARYFYNLRFLWLLEPGDAILLPKLPTEGFMAYLAEVKQIDVESLHLVVIGNEYTSVNSVSVLDPMVIAQLRKIIIDPSVWKLEACYFNHGIGELADKLQLTLNPTWQSFIESDYSRLLNSKAEFRKISDSYNIPITEGMICYTMNELTLTLEKFLCVTGQVIVKQEYNSSGKGNIGIGIDESKKFVGVSKSVIVSSQQSINNIAQQLWHEYNDKVIVEVYYPNKGTFTAQYWLPESDQEPTLLNYSEIMMESQWVGVRMPPRELAADQVKLLIDYSRQYADIMQKKGYQGYLCCDAILSLNNKLLFTEINVRPGAETHAYVLARHLFGVNHDKKMVILTLNTLTTYTFDQLMYEFKNKGLLLEQGDSDGVIVLTIDDMYSKKLEYMIVAPDDVMAGELAAVVKFHL